MYSCLPSVDLMYWWSILKSQGHFVVLLYNKTSRRMKVGESRQHKYFKRSRGLEVFPPTQTALTSTFCVQHTNFSGLGIWEKVYWKGAKTSWFHGMGMARRQTPWLAEQPAAEKPDAESEKQPWLSVWTTLEQAGPFLLLANSLFCKQYCCERSAH